MGGWLLGGGTNVAGGPCGAKALAGGNQAGGADDEDVGGAGCKPGLGVG